MVDQRPVGEPRVPADDEREVVDLLGPRRHGPCPGEAQGALDAEQSVQRFLRSLDTAVLGYR